MDLVLKHLNLTIHWMNFYINKNELASVTFFKFINETQGSME